jgi:hypothetical protein
MTVEQEHCKSEGRCMDFAFAPKEWREGDICHICGCDGDTRSKSRQHIPDCPYHKYQCRYEFAGEATPEQHSCKKDGTVVKNIEQFKKDERDKVLDDLLNLFQWINKEGNFRPWNIGHIEDTLKEYRLTRSKQEAP